VPIENQQAETALQLERDKLKAVVANVSFGLVLCDAQGGHITMNPAALRFHGFSSEQDMNLAKR
jgi:PAS domain-containing protein